MYAPNTHPQPEYCVLSLSGGKDSTALGLEWLKRHQQDPATYPLHEVVYCDYINPTKFREYVGAEAFNSFFGLTA